MKYKTINENKTGLKRASGQALLIVVVFMSAIMLGISVITGYLFVQRIRTSADITRSTQAIFAADAGLEAQLYDIFQNQGFLSTSAKTIQGTLEPASFEATREDNGTGFSITSLGTSEVSRQLRLDVNFR
jgi:hypothetical protein